MTFSKVRIKCHVRASQALPTNPKQHITMPAGNDMSAARKKRMEKLKAARARAAVAREARFGKAGAAQKTKTATIKAAAAK